MLLEQEPYFRRSRVSTHFYTTCSIHVPQISTVCCEDSGSGGSASVWVSDCKCVRVCQSFETIVKAKSKFFSWDSHRGARCDFGTAPNKNKHDTLMNAGSDHSTPAWTQGQAQNPCAAFGESLLWNALGCTFTGSVFELCSAVI